MSFHVNQYVDINQAAIITHGAFVSTVTGVTLHLPEVAVIISALASLAGVGLQFWIAFGKMRDLEENQKKQEIDNKVNAARVGAVEDRQTFQEIKPAPIVVVPVPITPKDLK